MRHFIAYHNTEKMGRPLHDGEPLRLLTNKPVNHLLHNTVWFVTGEGATRQYSLGSVFRVAEVGDGAEEGFKRFDIEGFIEVVRTQDWRAQSKVQLWVKGAEEGMGEEPWTLIKLGGRRTDAAVKAAATRKRRAAGRKAARTKKRRAAGRKAAATRKAKRSEPGAAPDRGRM